MRRFYAWCAAGIAVVAIAGTGAYVATGAGDRGTGTRVAEFSDQGVTVTIDVKDRAATHARLVATLTPDRPGFHLYSIHLPANGMNGVGRPVTLVPQGALTAAGPLTAEAKETTFLLAGTDLKLPVYPDGPVTVDLPVTIAGRGGATVLVGYAACSESACLPPVSDHPVQITIS
jgi:hypothetical protein